MNPIVKTPGEKGAAATEKHALTSLSSGKGRGTIFFHPDTWVGTSTWARSTGGPPLTANGGQTPYRRLAKFSSIVVTAAVRLRIQRKKRGRTARQTPVGGPFPPEVPTAARKKRRPSREQEKKRVHDTLTLGPNLTRPAGRLERRNPASVFGMGPGKGDVLIPSVKKRGNRALAETDTRGGTGRSQKANSKRRRTERDQLKVESTWAHSFGTAKKKKRAKANHCGVNADLISARSPRGTPLARRVL